MSWQLPLSVLASAALLSAASVYGSVNDHRSRMCRLVADKISHHDIRSAGDLTKERTILEWSVEEYAYSLSIEECRHSLVPWR